MLRGRPKHCLLALRLRMMDHISRIPDGMNFTNWSSSLGSLIHWSFFGESWRINKVWKYSSFPGLGCEHCPEAEAKTWSLTKKDDQTVVQLPLLLFIKCKFNHSTNIYWAPTMCWHCSIYRRASKDQNRKLPTFIELTLECNVMFRKGGNIHKQNKQVKYLVY